MLSFIVGLAMMLNGANLGGTVKDVFDDVSNVLASINGDGKEFDIPASLAAIYKIRKHYNEGSNAGKQDYRRGMIRSGWLDGSEDAEIAEIKGIMPDLGATAWVDMLGEGANYTDDPEAHKMYKGDKGLYWTTEDLSSVTFTGGTGDKKDYSTQKLLSYYYNESENKYYVIKNNVWLNQKDVSGQVALSALHQEWEKPPAEIVNTASTYAEAKKIYEETKQANNGSFIF